MKVLFSIDHNNVKGSVFYVLSHRVAYIYLLQYLLFLIHIWIFCQNIQYIIYIINYSHTNTTHSLYRQVLMHGLWNPQYHHISLKGLQQKPEKEKV